MRTVLYADDMEPITVINLPPVAVRYLETNGVVRLAIDVPPFLEVPTRGWVPNHSFPTVSIVAETFIRRGERHMLLFTHNEESALLLKSAFLPGQQAELKLRDRDAFARGVMRALEMLGGSGED